MENEEGILSLYEFTKLSGLNGKTVRYHLSKGHIASTTYVVEKVGIPRSELDRLDEIVKRSDAKTKRG
jgi:hypothetical protein